MTDWKTTPRWLLALAFIAAGAGLYARFKGLGASPFSVDEYYLARSIEDVLRTGLPQFDCGGYYVRGLLLQYLAAALQAFGLSGELAPRLIGASCNALSLPAIYLLGRRLRGPTVGLLAVIVLSLSVWEVEMSRFGRMYAPFQALFLWYSVYFVRFVVDRERRALWMMVVLSIAAPLVWEGGPLVALANLLALLLLRSDAKLQWRDVWPLAAGGALLVAGFLLTWLDFRLINGDEFPLGLDPQGASTQDFLKAMPSPLQALRSHPLWLVAGLLPVILAAWALRWVWSLRTRPLLALGLALALGAALAHQFLLAALVVTVLLLMRYIRFDELVSRAAMPFHLALAGAALFWLLFSVSMLQWRGASGGGTVRDLAALVYPFVSLPDFANVVLRPIVRVMPVMGFSLLMLIGICVWRNLRQQLALDAERTLLVLLVVTLMTACLASPARMETRYIFFAYPLALVIAIATVETLVRRLARRDSLVTIATTGVAIGGFALAEDFQPVHLRHVDAPAILYRSNLSDAVQAHYEPREDLRALAGWLQQNDAPGTVLINGVHGLDVYFPAFDYFHVDPASDQFIEFSCRRGTVERWGNYPLVYDTADLAGIARGASRTLLVTFNYDEQAVLQAFAAAHPRIVRKQGHLVVLELGG